MKLNKKLIIYEKRFYSYLSLIQISCQSILFFKNFFVPISHNQGFMGVCGAKGLPQKMENIKLKEKLRLGRQSSLPRQSRHTTLQKFLYKSLSPYLRCTFCHLLPNHQSHRQTNQVPNMLSVQFYLLNLSK